MKEMKIGIKKLEEKGSDLMLVSTEGSSIDLLGAIVDPKKFSKIKDLKTNERYTFENAAIYLMKDRVPFSFEGKNLLEALKVYACSLFEAKGQVDTESVYEILVETHDFTSERVNSALDRLEENKTRQQQKGLGDFF